MRLAVLPLALLALVACTSRSNDTTPPESEAQAPVAATAASNHEFTAAIDAGDFEEHVKTLASDAFGGRGPGTPGEDASIDYIKTQFARIGLQPGNGSDWFQTVPMVETTADESTSLKLAVAGKAQELKFGTDMVIVTRTGRADVNVKDSDLVFVGYGVDAPERNWNDYAGIDVKGKTVVMLVNDPGFHVNDAKLFDGKRMTYYGRWTYKFDEAARKGAAAALIIHDTEGASYGWDVVKNSWSGPQYDLPAKDDPAPRIPAQGWITGDAARTLFTGAGLDLDKLRAAANKPGFKPVPMNAKLSFDLKSTTVEKTSRNVIGMLPGSETPDEAIIYMAHWDHLGTHAGEVSAENGGDNIYNGAVDNATGVAGILEIAEAFRKAPTPPKRSILFLAVTLEESGLLGSQYYVAHPVVPLDKTVAVFNIDALAPIGKANDIIVVGKGSSQLEDALDAVLAKQNRKAVVEDNPAAGYYFRSDHFNFAKAGVPAIYVDSGSDLIDGGKSAGEAAGKDYTDNRYHKPGDQFDAETWKVDGIIQDLETLQSVGAALANDGQWPNWYEGNPFKAARDAMRPIAPTAVPASPGE